MVGKEIHQKLFEDTIYEFIHVFIRQNPVYFTREHDIQSYLYHSLLQKFRNKTLLFPTLKGQKIFPVHTEWQYKYLKSKKQKHPISLNGRAVDLVILSAAKKKVPIKVALEIKFSTPILDSGKKESSGDEKLGEDIGKLMRLHAHHKYFLYCKNGGDCFLTSHSKSYHKRRKQFFDRIDRSKTLKDFWMYYVENEDHNVLPHLYLYTVCKKDGEVVRLRSKKEHNPKLHHKILIYSNSEKTREHSISGC